MMRSLFTGVSGLRSHQFWMDVIGNNIANINTIGFKAGRVTFEEALAQTLRAATRPVGNRGGVNPMQIGLGTSLGSIDTLFTQGTPEVTGVQTDLAIQGDAFFVLSDGQKEYYTRAGAFRFDANGRLICPYNGYVVQGIMADQSGQIPSEGKIQDIVLPLDQKIPAKATTKVQFKLNLDASESPQGTITSSNPLLAVEEAGDDSDLNGLYARGKANSMITGMVPGITTVTVSDGTTITTYTYVNQDAGDSSHDFHSLDDLIAEINNDYAGILHVELNSEGAILITNQSGSEIELNITSSNGVLQTALSAANGRLAANETAQTDEFSHRATADEELTKLRDCRGNALNLSVGDIINISGNVGGDLRSDSLTVAADTTLKDLADKIKQAFGITNSNGVIINSSGAIEIRGDPGEDNAITSVSIQAAGRTNFNSTMTFTETQPAKDVTFSTDITLYDDIGQEHILSLTFTKTTTSNLWNWEAHLSGSEVLISGNTGTISFNPDGSLASFTYEGGANSLKFDPANGASPVSVVLDMGTINGFDGVTQLSAPSATLSKSQDGYAAGELVSIAIDTRGRIVGSFTNGVSQTLAQIVLAAFNNPGGLLRVGDNMFVASPNSGVPVKGVSGETIQSTLLPGALEMSNVDLAQEFTNMIVAQRGFQANARIITTTDDMLRELLNLKR